MQRYVIEHIVKNDEASLHMSSHRLRVPRPQHESDYDTWRSGVELLMKDLSISDLQRSRKIFESLLPPAADMVKHLRADTPPVTYLQILDSAYGTVQDGDECLIYGHFSGCWRITIDIPTEPSSRIESGSEEGRCATY